MVRRYVIAGVVAVLAPVACSRGDGAGGAAGKGVGERPVPVATATVAKRDVPLYLDGIGSATAYKTVTVHTQVDGRLDEVFFQEGQAVKKGDLLAQIDPRPFQNQLHQAQGALARDQAQWVGARANLKRFEELSGQNYIAKQQAEDQRALVGQLDGTLLMDRAAIDSARLNLDYARIVAPLDGLTGIRQVDAGNLVHAGDPTGIVVLAQIDPIAVLFTLPQDALPLVADAFTKGAPAVRVTDRDGTTVLGEGRLEVLDNAINATTATLRLKAVLPNPDHHLWPNQFVKVRLMLSVRADAIVVPASTLQRGPEGTFVYVVAADQTAEARKVEVERLQGDEALVAKGLQPGEVVVIEGQNQLRPGGKVAMRGAEGRRPTADGEGRTAPGPDGREVKGGAPVGKGEGVAP